MRKIALRQTVTAVPLPVMVDRIQVQQVLINLMLNGMDAMAGCPEGRRELDVATRLTAEGEAEVVVRDHGCGFARLERVFESFFTTKPQGMGLGLSISAAIIASHGGRVWAENNNGGGASVGFRMPLHGGELA